MTRRTHWLTRRGVVTGVLSAAGGSVLAGAPSATFRPVPRPVDTAPPPPIATAPVPRASEALIKAARLTGDVGFAVTDVETGEVLESRLGGKLLPPASTLKVVTALYALDRLGSDHTFETRLLATGPIKNGKIEGDLILAGGGDPTLDTDRLADLAKSLREVGVTEVAGRYLLWPDALPRGKRIDGEQPEHVAYNPSYGGLNLNFNRVHVQWEKKGNDLSYTMHARGRNFSPSTAISQMAVIDRKAPVFEYRDWGARDQWSVAEWALKKDGARWLPVRYPALYCGDVFRTLARSNGIVLKAPEILDALPEAPGLASVLSPSLVPMLQGMLKYSTNLTAEAVGLAASQTAGSVDDLSASGARMSGWSMANFGVAGVRFMDHSGLGYGSAITPGDLSRILAANAGVAPLLKTVNMPETLARSGLVRAKTGTLNFVSSLAGFVTTKGGRDLAFSILTADTARRDAIPPAERERPQGAKSWARRSRRLQKQLILDWAKRLT